MISIEGFTFNRLHEISWTTFSAIGTFVAVGVALFLHHWQEKSKINVVVAVGPRYADTKKAIITIANQGNRAETIIRIHYNDGGEIAELNGQGFILPKTIPAHGVEYFDSPYLAYNIGTVIDIIAEDAIGNQWHCDKKNFKHVQKVLLNYRGPAGAMFDKDKSE